MGICGMHGWIKCKRKTLYTHLQMHFYQAPESRRHTFTLPHIRFVYPAEARDMLTNSNIPQGAVIATRAPRIPVVRISGKINPSVKSERSIEIMAPACMRLRAQSEQMKNSERTFTKHLVSRRPSPKKRRRARALAHTHGESSYTY